MKKKIKRSNHVRKKNYSKSIADKQIFLIFSTTN